MKTKLYGLVLAGGKSRRMGRDKGLMTYHGKPQVQVVADLLSDLTDGVFLSCREDQYTESEFLGLPRLVDSAEAAGPLAGILAGFDHAPDAAWLVVACDLPLLDKTILKEVIAQRSETADVVAYRSAYDDLPEPLCAVYEPGFRPVLLKAAVADLRCPRKILLRQAERVCLLKFSGKNFLDNINSTEDAERIQEFL